MKILHFSLIYYVAPYNNDTFTIHFTPLEDMSLQPNTYQQKYQEILQLLKLSTQPNYILQILHSNLNLQEKFQLFIIILQDDKTDIKVKQDVLKLIELLVAQENDEQLTKQLSEIKAWLLNYNENSLFEYFNIVNKVDLENIKPNCENQVKEINTDEEKKYEILNSLITKLKQAEEEKTLNVDECNYQISLKEEISKECLHKQQKVIDLMNDKQIEHLNKQQVQVILNYFDYLYMFKQTEKIDFEIIFYVIQKTYQSSEYSYIIEKLNTPIFVKIICDNFDKFNEEIKKYIITNLLCNQSVYYLKDYCGGQLFKTAMNYILYNKPALIIQLLNNNKQQHQIFIIEDLYNAYLQQIECNEFNYAFAIYFDYLNIIFCNNQAKSRLIEILERKTKIPKQLSAIFVSESNEYLDQKLFDQYYDFFFDGSFIQHGQTEQIIQILGYHIAKNNISNLNNRLQQKFAKQLDNHINFIKEKILIKNTTLNVKQVFEGQNQNCTDTVSQYFSIFGQISANQELIIKLYNIDSLNQTLFQQKGENTEQSTAYDLSNLQPVQTMKIDVTQTVFQLILEVNQNYCATDYLIEFCYQQQNCIQQNKLIKVVQNTLKVDEELVIDYSQQDVFFKKINVFQTIGKKIRQLNCDEVEITNISELNKNSYFVKDNQYYFNVKYANKLVLKCKNQQNKQEEKQNFITLSNQNQPSKFINYHLQQLKQVSLKLVADISQEVFVENLFKKEDLIPTKFFVQTFIENDTKLTPFDLQKAHYLNPTIKINQLSVDNEDSATILNSKQIANQLHNNHLTLFLSKATTYSIQIQLQYQNQQYYSQKIQYVLNNNYNPINSLCYLDYKDDNIIIQINNLLNKPLAKQKISVNFYNQNVTDQFKYNLQTSANGQLVIQNLELLNVFDYFDIQTNNKFMKFEVKHINMIIQNKQSTNKINQLIINVDQQTTLKQFFQQAVVVCENQQIDSLYFEFRVNNTPICNSNNIKNCENNVLQQNIGKILNCQFEIYNYRSQEVIQLLVSYQTNDYQLVQFNESTYNLQKIDKVVTQFVKQAKHLYQYVKYQEQQAILQEFDQVSGIIVTEEEVENQSNLPENTGCLAINAIQLQQKLVEVEDQHCVLNGELDMACRNGGPCKKCNNRSGARECGGGYSPETSIMQLFDGNSKNPFVYKIQYKIMESGKLIATVEK